MKQLPLLMSSGPAPSFDNFVIGRNSQAVEHLRRRPLPPTPVYLWGPSGVGKSHLLQAVARSAELNGERVGSFSLRDATPWSFDESWRALVFDDCESFNDAQQHAAFALFVDNGAEARALLRNNVEALGLGGVTKVYRRDATDLGPAHPMEPFSLVFLDPPYRMKLAEKALASMRDGGWLTPGALLVVEEAKAAAFAAPEGFAELERRAYDDTEFTILRFGEAPAT